jgi:sugar O-acyltransferase (sialic acid O-acetyltransferase NeuD family)
MIKEKFCIIGVDNDYVDFIKRNSSFFIGYFSKKGLFYKSINKKKRLGDHVIKTWNTIKKKYNPTIIITMDDGKIREKLFKKIYRRNCNNLFLKHAYVAASSLRKLNKNKGILIQDFAKIMSNVKIFDGVKIHVGAHVHHDCKIGKFSTIAPKAVILGNVQIGDYSYIGANSTIKQRIKIGRGATVGAGSVVVKDVKSNDIVAGVPAKSIKN